MAKKPKKTPASPKTVSLQDKHKAVFKGLKQLLKTHGIKNDIHGLLLTPMTAEPLAGCINCPPGHCKIFLDPITNEQTAVCM